MNQMTSQTYTTCGSTFQKSLENEGKYASPRTRIRNKAECP